MNHQHNIVCCFERLIQKNNLASGTNKTIGFKNRAHKKIIEDILTHFTDDTTPLSSIAQLKGRAGYGKSTMARIEEIIQTGTLKELEEKTTIDPTTVLIQELLSITGIGPVKATKIVALGGSLKMLQDAIANNTPKVLTPFQLTPHQRLGLKYYEDLMQRIPHSVIQQFDVFLQAQCKKMHIPCQAIICGSYRRGKTDSGDIDILLTRDDWQDEKQAKTCLQVVLNHLEDEGVLIDHLTSPTKCKTKYMGFLRLPCYDYACRVDIRAVIYKQYIPALAYFTGSGEENVRLRSIALKQNMKLNEYGLTHTDTGEPIPLTSEEQLYDALGEEFVLPTMR